MDNIQVTNNPIRALRVFLEDRSKELQKINVDLDINKVIMIILREVMTNENLLKCKPIHIFNAVSEIIELGLEVGSQHGEAYLIPRKDGKCQAMPGYKGFITLAYRNSDIRIIRAHPVYEGDIFEYELGLEIKIKHIPCGVADQSKITHAYAVVKLANGEINADVMTKAEIETARRQSMNPYVDNTWVAFYSEMAKKTVTKRLLKYVPKSKELTRAMAMDSIVSDNIYVDIEDVEEEIKKPKITKTNELVQKLQEKRQETTKQSVIEQVVEGELVMESPKAAPMTQKQESTILSFKKKLFKDDDDALRLFLNDCKLDYPTSLTQAKEVISELIKLAETPEKAMQYVNKSNPFIDE